MHNDRWCPSCNSYSQLKVCPRCKSATQSMQVLGNVKAPPKVRCVCGAAFAGFRFRNKTGNTDWAFNHTGTLTRQKLVIDLFTVPVGFDFSMIGARGPTDVRQCPHCQAPLLETRHTNRTALPLTLACKLVANPNQTVTLDVTCEMGVMRGT